MNYLISEDGAVLTEVQVIGPGQQQGTTAYTFSGHAEHVYAAPSWRVGSDKQELRRLFALRRCEALEHMARTLQQQSSALFQHAADLRGFLEMKA